MARLLEWNLLEESAAHRLRVTELGQTAAAAGLRSETVLELQAFTRGWMDRVPADMEILLACAFTADGETFPLSASRDEIRSRRWMTRVETELRRENAWEQPMIQAMLRPPGGLAAHRHNPLKLAAAARAWITRADTAELETSLGLAAGTIAAGAAHLAWLAGALHNCARVVGCPDAVLNRIATVALRLPPGLGESAQDLARLQIAGLSRNYLHRLADDGLDSPAAVAAACPQLLRRLLPAPLAEALMHELEAREGRHPAPAPPSVPSADVAPADDLAPTISAAVPAPPRFDLILDSEDPGTVVFRGEKVQLSPKPYALLGVLARRCGSTVSYREIDEKVWPDEKVEPQQISAHKSRLLRELARGGSLQEMRNIIVTAPRYGLRLELSPARVLVRPG